MGGAIETECVSITDLLSPLPWTELPVIRHGSGGERTDVICGYLDVDDPLFDTALGALPPIFVVRPTGAAQRWIESSLAYVLEATSGGDDDSHILTRLVRREALDADEAAEAMRRIMSERRAPGRPAAS